jgi:hypothetical protein
MRSPTQPSHVSTGGVAASPVITLDAPIRTAISGRPGVFTAATIILCVIVPGLLGGWQVVGHAGTKGSLPLQIAITVWAGLRLSKLWSRGEPRPFAVVFWLYVYVWLGLASMLQVIHQEAPYLIAISPSAYEQGQVIILLGLALLEIGHLFPARKEIQMLTNRQIVGSRVTVLVAFVLITAPLWYHLLGGFHVLFSSRQELAATVLGRAVSTQKSNLATGGIEVAFATVPTFVALYLVIVTRQYKLWHNSRLVLILLVIVALVLDNPISLPRFWTGTILTALVFAIPLVQRRAAAMRIVIAGMIFICIVLFPYAAYFRLSSGFKPPPGVVRTLTTKPDYDSFEMIYTGIQYTRDVGFRYGNQALADIFFFVPRALWSSKAPDTGALLGVYYNLPNTNLSAPLWIEAYIDFGYFGVIAIFFVYGLIMRRADDRFVKGDSPFAQFAIPLLAGYSCILLRGSLLAAMARLAVMLGIIWLVSKRGSTDTQCSLDQASVSHIC